VTLSPLPQPQCRRGKLTIAGISPATANTLTKSGTGTFVLTGVNTNAGDVTVSAGLCRPMTTLPLHEQPPKAEWRSIAEAMDRRVSRECLEPRAPAFQWQTSSPGGGFSAAGGQMTVNVGNDLRELTWGSTAGTHIIGTLKFKFVHRECQDTFSESDHISPT